MIHRKYDFVKEVDKLTYLARPHEMGPESKMNDILIMKKNIVYILFEVSTL